MPENRLNAAAEPARTQIQARAVAALQGLFVGDSLAMPAHWFYRRWDIEQAFPGGIRGLEAPPENHPSSIMALHSTRQGGRGRQTGAASAKREIVGDVILKGKRQFWGQTNMHYHQGMRAGDSTLNAHCARVLMRGLAGTAGHYQRDLFLDDYVAFMTAEPAEHPDTYAESYHRAFFANLEAGKAPQACAGVTHDTPSIGGLVTIAPLVIAELLAGTSLAEVQTLALQHLYLTHPDAALAQVCTDYVALIASLLLRVDESPLALTELASRVLGVDVDKLVQKVGDDGEIIGGHYSSACYIDGAWPGVLYLASKYRTEPAAGLLANANLGGDNAHRGAVLGVIYGLLNDAASNKWFGQLRDAAALQQEIDGLVAAGKQSLSRSAT
jgi:ADP-ribosylglycohydrolase